MEHRMIDARILQAQGLTQLEIGKILGVTDRTVRNYLAEQPRARIIPKRASKLDPFKDLIRERISTNPNLNGELVYESIKKMGYTGKRSILKDYITKLRREFYKLAVIRFETEPGLQAQADWVDFGTRYVDGKYQKLYAFTMALGYSRMPFVWFTTDMQGATLLASHAKAFGYFDGVPAEILYDNMKAAWLYDGEQWRPNKKLSAFACHYGYIPRRCQVRRPETKGKVERFNQYLERNFFAGLNQNSLRLDELNESVLAWIEKIQGNIINGLGESRAERFEHERMFLKPLPDCEFDCRDAVTLVVSRESCITWKTNQYSVNPRYIGQKIVFRPAVFGSYADIFAEDSFIKTIHLEPEGSMRRILDPADREEIRKRWEKDREWQSRHRIPKQRTTAKLLVDVCIRSPSYYDALMPGGSI